MPATKHYITGTAEWAKVYEHNKDEYMGKTFFAIDLLISEEDAERFISTGSRHKPTRESEGVFRIKLRRNEDAAEEEWGGPPKVIQEDPDDDSHYIPFTELIGNGSVVTVAFTVYDSKFGKGTRLESVRVDKHVEFGGTRVDTTGIDVPF